MRRWECHTSSTGSDGMRRCLQWTILIARNFLYRQIASFTYGRISLGPASYSDRKYDNTPKFRVDAVLTAASIDVFIYPHFRLWSSFSSRFDAITWAVLPTTG